MTDLSLRQNDGLWEETVLVSEYEVLNTQRYSNELFTWIMADINKISQYVDYVDELRAKIMESDGCTQMDSRFIYKWLSTKLFFSACKNVYCCI